MSTLARPARAPGPTAPTAPIVDAVLEPRPAAWPVSAADDTLTVADVVDAEIVDDDPAVGSAVGSAVGGASAGEAVTWPCACGTAVALTSNVCPTCGGEFLGAVKEGGRHRKRRLSSRSRGTRLVLAGLLALIVAIGVPGLLALVG